MQKSDLTYVQSAVKVSHAVQVGIVVLAIALVFAGGPILSVWMHINSMQLLAQVVLISVKLPGNAHFFLLDHLRIHLQLCGLATWF